MNISSFFQIWTWTSRRVPTIFLHIQLLIQNHLHSTYNQCACDSQQCHSCKNNTIVIEGTINTSLNFCPTTTPLHHASSHTKFHGFLLQSFADLTNQKGPHVKQFKQHSLPKKPTQLTQGFAIPINSNAICFPFFFWSHTPRSL